jgi:beta-lactamase regulating signal transducer with metallopeptidase domain
VIGPVELLTLSMGLSVTVSALALAAGALIEARSSDPTLRDRIWGAALILSLTPVLAGAILLLTPAPVREVSIPTLVPIPAAAMVDATPAAVGTADIAPDFGLLALVVLGAAAALVGLRAIGLALRSVRLALILREARPADAVVERQVARAAAALGVAAPTTMVSAKATEALLSGLGRARLILPESLAPDAADAVIRHELAHLKRGDHRLLWLEELAAVLLAFNPVIPLIRARRDGAREEACDALALGDAAPEVRRIYAQTLIEALRNRAGSQSPAPAGRRTRLIAGLAGLSLLTAIGGATVALADQREPEVRVAQASPGDWSPAFPTPGEYRINGQRIAFDPAGKMFSFQAREVVTPPTAAGEAPAWIDFKVDLSPNAPPLSLEGAPLPRGVTTDFFMPDSVERIERTSRGLNVILKQDPPADASAHSAARQAHRAAANVLTPRQQARYRNVSAADYRDICASADAVDDGFCSGVMFSHLNRASDDLCLPAIPDDGARELAALVSRGKAQMARLAPRTDEGAYEYSGRALRAAYPCAAPRPALQPAPASNRPLSSEPAIVFAPAAPALTMAMLEPVAAPALAGLSSAPGVSAAPQVVPPVTRQSPLAERDFLQRQREARNAARVNLSERGLQTPGWPRPDHPQRRAPFANERRAAQAQ